jgi:hypothetical protein
MDYNNEEFNNRDDYCSKWALDYTMDHFEEKVGNVG